jgi:hypothetical protein
MKPMPKTWPAPVAEGGGTFGARTPAETARGPEEWPNGISPGWARSGDNPYEMPERDDLGTIKTSNGRSVKRGR